MSSKIVKYNPSFLNDQELIDSFVVRYSYFDLVMEVVCENNQGSNQHLLVIGPRGSGKTTLLRRVIAEIHQNPELNALWFPIPFGEESYEVASAGEFWLESFHYLEALTGDQSWGIAYNELLGEQDEKRLRQRCLGRLLDFADKEGKRLLFVVENLNLMMGDQLNDDDAWALRETLMHEPRLMLLGSATNRFDEITKHDQAMFELFRIIEFQRLTLSECQQVWHRVSGQKIMLGQARAVQILTGGNPRLLTILAVFGAKRSFSSLMDDLSLLVDEHTDYFKSNFESLPTTERKVFACLATLWEDSFASEVARVARMSSSKVSALLKRLETRGAVREVSREGRKKKYQLAERLYNIYYLMRRGQNSGRVRAVVHFMRQFYGQERLYEAVGVIAREACCMADGQRQEHYWAIRMMCNFPEAYERLDKLRDVFPKDFCELPDLPEDVKRIVMSNDVTSSSDIEVLQDKIVKLAQERQWEEAVVHFRKLLDFRPNSSWAWAGLGNILAYHLDQIEEGVDCLRKSLELNSNDAWALGFLGDILLCKLNLYEEGVECLRRSIEIDSSIGWVWGFLGDTLLKNFDQLEEALLCLRKAAELGPNKAYWWRHLGEALTKQWQSEEAVNCLRKAVELESDDAYSWALLGENLGMILNQPEESVDCLRKAVELDPDDAWSWALLGEILSRRLGQIEEGLTCLRRSVDLAPNLDWAWGVLGENLIYELDQIESGLNCLRKAIEVNPENATYLGLLGETLAKKVNAPDEGLIYLRKAVEVDSNYAIAWAVLGYILIIDFDSHEEGCECLRKAFDIEKDILKNDYLFDKILKGVVSVDKIELILNCTERPGDLLNSISCYFIDSEAYEHLDKIENWAREAVAKIGDNFYSHSTLSMSLSLQGKITEALDNIAIVLEHPNIVIADIKEFTEILSIAAALGYGQEALEVLLNSKSSDILEPVVAGLKQSLGYDYNAPQEVKEIGEDIVKRVEYWKEWHANRSH